MGLFLAPFSGHAVGGGGHGVTDPSPPGTDPGAGFRIDVDTVNRTPLRLLRSTMKGHKPKIMKITPPGQLRGAIAPPYAWDALERDDWRYELPKRKFVKEDGSSSILPPLEAPRTPSAPTDPRKARIDSISQQLDQMRAELKQLHARRDELVRAGKSVLQKPVEDLDRRALRLLRESEPPGSTSFVRQETPEEFERRLKQQPPGPASSDPSWIHRLDKKRSGPASFSRTPLPSPSFQRKRERQRLMGRELAARGLAPQRPTRSAPPQSPEIISLSRQIDQLVAEIKRLHAERKMLRAQMKQSHESIGLSSNNRRRLVLLLK